MKHENEVLITQLLSGRPRILHGEKYFTDHCIAMLHAAVAVRNTEYEGIPPSYSFNYFKQLLALPTHPIDLGLSPEQLNAAQEAVQDLIYFTELIFSFVQIEASDEPSAQDDKVKKEPKVTLNIDLAKVIAAIRTRCESRATKHCYFPSGWTGDKQGHFAGLKMILQPDGRYKCSFIDRGAGNVNHLPLATSGDKFKRDYQSLPKLIDFTHSAGKEFLEDIIRLKIDRRPYDEQEVVIKKVIDDFGKEQSITLPKNNMTIKHYSEEDAYGSLISHGENTPDIDSSLMRASTPQRTGTCSVSNTKTVTQDAIQSAFPVTLLQMKRYKFALKLSSLVEAYKAYCHGLCKFEVLQWALREHYVRITKHYPEVLNAKEAAFCTEIGLAIGQRLQNDSAANIALKCIDKPLPPLIGNWHATKEQQLVNQTYTPSTELKNTNDENNITLIISDCDPINVLAYLKQACHFIIKHKDLAGFMQLREFMHSLSETSGTNEDKYWDHVPADHLVEVIQCLCDLVSYNVESTNDSVNLYKFEVALIAYDIAVQLSSRFPELKLGNNYSLVLDDIYSDKYFFFDPVSYYTVKQIAVNFQSRCQGKRIILSNAINYDNSDNTQDYVMQVLLDDEKRHVAINLLKDKNALDSHVTNIADNKLFAILMTKKCQIRNAQGKIEWVEFNTDTITGTLFNNILKLAATVHAVGCLTAAYQNPEQHGNTHNAVFYFSEQAYHHELKLGKTLQAKNSFLGLEKHFPTMVNDVLLHQDFSENTIFHPYDDLVYKRSLQDNKRYEHLTTHSNKQEEEIVPYEIRLSGTLHTGKQWDSFKVDNNIAEELDEDLRSIEITPSLQVVRALAWAQYYVERLQSEGVRDRLFELLFQYDRIDLVLANSPAETLQLLSSFLETGITFYQNREESKNFFSGIGDNCETFLWLCRVYEHFQYYIEIAAKLYQFDISHFTLPNIRAILIEKLQSSKNLEMKSRFAVALVNTYRNARSYSLDDYVQLLTCHILYHLEPHEASRKKLDETNIIFAAIWSQQYAAIMTALYKLTPEVLNNTINNIMKLCINITEDYQWRIEGQHLKADGFEQGIDLRKGLLTANQYQQRDLTKKFEGKGIIRIVGFKQNEYTLLEHSPGVVKTPDGKYEFHYHTSNWSIKEVYKIILLEGKLKRFKLIHEEDDGRAIQRYFAQLKLVNPFSDIENSFWHSDDNDKTLLVIPINTPTYAYVRTQLQGWVKVIPSNNNGWMRDGHVLLDFSMGDTDLEKQWAQRLEQMVGLTRIIAEGKLIANNQCQIETINLSRFDLNFIYNNNRLESVEHPEYYLSEKQSIPQLHGLPSIIILKNDFNEEKYIIPALKINDTKDNCAFDHTNITDNQHLCSYISNYFIYELDRTGELVGNNVHADLYLTSLYACLGDYQRAMRALNRTEHHQNNYSGSEALTEGLVAHADQSPLGVALVCKVACRMYRHMNKWTKYADGFWPTYAQRAPRIITYALEQLKYYHETVSFYKIGVNIIPDYLRLDDVELQIMQELDALVNQRKASNFWTFEKPKKLKPKIIVGQSHCFLQSERLASTTELNYCKDEKSKFDDILKNLNLDDARHRRQSSQHIPSLRYYYGKSDSALNAKKNQYGAHPSSAPAADYLKCYFVNFFEEAISGNDKKIKALKATLYQIFQNDVLFSDVSILVPTLVFVINYPQHFRNLPRFDTTKECFNQVAKRCNESVFQYRLKNKFLLFDLEVMVPGLEHQDSLPNILSAHTALQFSLGKILIADKFKQHLSEFFQLAYTATPRPVAQGPFLLDSPGMENPTLIEQNLLAHYRSGHEANKTKTKFVYRINADADILVLKDQLLEFTGPPNKQHDAHPPIIKKNAKIVLEECLSALLRLANFTPLEIDNSDENQRAKANVLLASRGSEQLSRIDISDLISFLLCQDVAILTRKNCFLTQQHIDELLEKFCDYLLKQSQYDQAMEALRIIGNNQCIADLGKYNEQLLGSILNGQRTYDVKEFPEFLVYEYATKRLIRPDQVKPLIDLIHLIESGLNSSDAMRHALLQFAAGGGKSSVMIILLAYRFARMGLMPVIFNTNELYNIALNDIPENLKMSLRQKMEVIERELEHKWTKEEFDQLLSDLKEWHKQKKCLLIKAVTWHAINIAKRIAYAESIGKVAIDAEKNKALALSASKVLDFFRDNCIKLEDENQIISDPLQETIKTYGPMQAIPLDQQQLFVRFYDFLMGFDPDCAKLLQLAGIADKSKNIVSEKTLALIQNLLVQKIMKEDFFSAVNKTELETYLLQLSRKRPPWLIQLYNPKVATNTADLIVLARSFIKTHLPHILTMQYAKDYRDSIHKNDLTVGPKHDGKDVTSHFSDQMLVMALTIQLHAQQGVRANYIRKIIDTIESDHIREQKWNKTTTDAEKFLNNILPPNYPYVFLDGIGSQIKVQLCNDTRVCLHSAMIKEFLYQYALPQIRTPKYRMVSTPADLQAGFRYSIMFSATPGSRVTLPVFLPEENCFLDAGFEAEVIDTLLQEKNAKHVLIDMAHSPQEFFAQLRKESPVIFNEMSTLIDRGALLSNSSAREVIAAYLTDVIDTTQFKAAVCFETDHMLLQSKIEQVGEIHIPGTRIAEALRRKGLKAEQFLLFLFLHLCNTTGTDVKRPHNDCAGLTVGKEQTITETIQAAMRERLLLWEDAQYVLWVMFKSLYREVYQSDIKFDRVHIFYWMLHNQAEQERSKIVMRAYQGIYQQIGGLIWQAVDSGKVSYAQYHEKLQKSYEMSPFKMYEIESTLEEAKKVLDDYVTELCQFFGMKQENLPLQTIKWIQQIITETCLWIEKMRQPHGAELNAQVCQEQTAQSEKEQEMQEEQKIKSLFDKHTHFYFNLERYHRHHDRLENIFSINSQYKVLSLRNCNHINVPRLYMRAIDFTPIRPQYSDRNYADIMYLKPIKILLVQITQNNHMQFVACTAAGVELYRQQIANKKFNENDVAYALIGVEGQILYASANLSAAKKSHLLQSDELQEMVTYAVFLNGRIANPEVLARIAKKFRWSHHNYKELVSAISQVHVSRHPIKLMNAPKFERLCGWKTDQPRFRIPNNDAVKVQKQATKLTLMSLQVAENLPVRVCVVERNFPARTALYGCVLEKVPQPRCSDNGLILRRFPKIKAVGFIAPANQLLPTVPANDAANTSVVPQLSEAFFDQQNFLRQLQTRTEDVKSALLADQSKEVAVERIQVSENRSNYLNNNVAPLQKAQLISLIKTASDEYCGQNFTSGFWGFFSRHGETGKRNARIFKGNCEASTDLNALITLISNHITNGPGNFRPASFKTILMNHLNTGLGLAIAMPSASDLAHMNKVFCQKLESKKIAANNQDRVNVL